MHKNRNICLLWHREISVLRSFGVTKPTTGTDTTSLKTAARRHGDKYIVNGQKVWISRVRAFGPDGSPRANKSVENALPKPMDFRFIVDLRGAKRGLTVTPIDAMRSITTLANCFLTISKFRLKISWREHNGSVVLDGMNAERVLIGAECIGDARYFIDKATAYRKIALYSTAPLVKIRASRFLSLMLTPRARPQP